MRNNVVKKYIFLQSVECVYSHHSDDYLIALRDALNIIIRQRKVGGLNLMMNIIKVLYIYES